MKQFKEMTVEFTKQWAYRSALGYVFGVAVLGVFSYLTKD